MFWLGHHIALSARALYLCGPSQMLCPCHLQWVFWVGPLCSGFLAGTVYELLFRTRSNKARGSAARAAPHTCLH